MLAPRRKARSGAAAVEFAFVLPVLCLLLIGLWEIGRLTQVTQIVDNAAREGGRLAASGSWTSSNSHPSTTAPSEGYDYEVQRKVLMYLNNAGINTANCSVTVTNYGPSGNTAKIGPVTYTATSNYSTSVVNYNTSTIVGTFITPTSFVDPALGANPTTVNISSGGTIPNPDRLGVSVTVPYSNVSWSPMNWFIGSGSNITATVYWNSARNNPLFFTTNIPQKPQ